MQETLSRLRAFYLSGATRAPAARIAALKRLEIAIGRREEDILRALAEDLGKSPEEAYLTEISFVKEELRHAMRHLRRWSFPRPVLPSIGQFPGYGRVLRDPYGVVLILSPWNYPFQLSLTPLVAAVAAGNCALLRPSSHAPRTAEVIAALVRESFPPEHVMVALCDTAEANAWLGLPFDKIFFTGSPAVGREVMRAAAENLTPVTLELGGKSPVIVAADADVRLAARRIVFGKFLNAGQTCIAPDYVLVAEPIEKAFLAMLAREIEAQYSRDPLHSPDLAQIVSDRHVGRLMGLLDSGRIACGGQVDRANRRIAPTVLTDVAEDAPIMQSEIFGPILPVLPFATMEEAIARVRARPAPLALYLFTAEKAAARRVMRDLAFGGGCVNDCIMHLTNLRMPFGGVGESGMGAYHGRAGFDCFTREKSVLTASVRVDVPIRYAPRKGKLKLFRGASKQK